MSLLYLLVGGMAGTVSRYVLQTLVNRTAGPGFPYGTGVINLLGCLLIGVISGAGDEHAMAQHHMRLLLVIGFCGAFTTFSSFILETSHLIEGGHSLRAFLNVVLSVLLGFVIFRFGVLLGNRL